MKTPAFVAACLLAAAFSAHAAQKPPKKPAAAQAETAPQDIDVDALARAKDGKPTEALHADNAATEQTADAADAAKEESTPEAAPATDETQTTEQTPATGQAPTTEPTPASDATPAPAADSAPPRDDNSATTRPAPLAPPSDAEKSLVASCEARATALLDAAQKGDFAAASRDFDANMRGKLKPEQFRQAWDSLAQFGALQARGQSHAAESQGYIAITVPLIFTKANLYAQVACGSDGRIAGFYVKPLESPAQ